MNAALLLLRSYPGCPLTEQADETFAPFFALSRDLLVVIDEALTIVRANPEFEKRYGTPSTPTVRRALLEFVAPAALVAAEAGLRSPADNAATFDAPLVQNDQLVRMCEWSVALEPKTRHRFVVLRDVTARRRLEVDLLSSQKLDAVGHLAAGIAHEINTPIQFIGNNLTFLAEATEEMLTVLTTLSQRDEGLMRQYPDFEFDYLREQVPRAIEQSCEGLQRVAELVRGMKEFVHKDQGKFAPTDINAAIERTLAVCRNEWRYVAEVEQRLGQIPLVSCLAGGIRQVLLNLICNAAQAIEERNIKTARKRGRIAITTATDKTHVTVAIADDGQGMPAGVKGRMFEPFFTTKEVGKGTGQGLALSRSIVVEKHRGELTFESEEGVGTTFIIRLPIHELEP